MWVSVLTTTCSLIKFIEVFLSRLLSGQIINLQSEEFPLWIIPRIHAPSTIWPLIFSTADFTFVDFNDFSWTYNWTLFNEENRSAIVSDEIFWSSTILLSRIVCWKSKLIEKQYVTIIQNAVEMWRSSNHVFSATLWRWRYLPFFWHMNWPQVNIDSFKDIFFLCFKQKRSLGICSMWRNHCSVDSLF